MFQCGFPVPASEVSELPVFRSIFIDIGDEQSSDDDLSTYSSHLLNMKNMLSGASSSALVLIDAFGSGTEPVIGGAIAEAILERLLAKGCYGVITGHCFIDSKSGDKCEVDVFIFEVSFLNRHI